MTRKLFTFLSSLSLLLCAATGALWACSFRWEMFFGHTAMPMYGATWYWHDWALWSQDGFVRLQSSGFEINDPRFANQWVQKPGRWRWKAQPLGTSGPQMGFPMNLRPRWDITSSGPPRAVRQVVIRSRHATVLVPYWCALVVTLPLPTIWMLRKHRHRKRLSQNLCPTCGYSLTGNTSGTCPECGVSVAAGTTETAE